MLKFGILLLGIVLTACSFLVEPGGRDEDRRIGLVIGFNDDDPRIVVPDTVEVGTPVVVEVTTYGNACKSKGETEVSLRGDTMVVTPYDYFDVRAGVCADILLTFLHEAVIEFDRHGSRHVRIVGRDARVFPPEVTEVSREVFVRPEGDPE